MLAICLRLLFELILTLRDKWLTVMIVERYLGL